MKEKINNVLSYIAWLGISVAGAFPGAYGAFVVFTTPRLHIFGLGAFYIVATIGGFILASIIGGFILFFKHNNATNTQQQSKEGKL